MAKKTSIDGGHTYMNGEDYDKKIKGLSKIEKINKFMEENLDSFDAYALVALNNSDEDSYEDNDGDLCRGTICMKLGSPEDAEQFIDSADTLKSMKIKPTVDDYKLATLAQLVQHLIEAHCEDKKSALNFVHTLDITMSHMDDSDTHNTAEHCLFEEGINQLRDKLLDNFSLEEAIILLNSTIDALDEWKEMLPELKKKYNKQFKKDKENKND